uniref:T cell receptor beta variable 16 n=1 Tax=Ursus americanus TaxID=9643 RepID=A0A452R7X4_URSAM
AGISFSTLPLCFLSLSAGHMGAMVIQIPRHQFTRVGKPVTLKMHCVPIKGHSYVFWYQQIPAKELKFLISFQNGVIFDKTGMPEKRFSAVCPQNSPCSLEIKPTELQDLAVYFCASSESTVVNIS